jgi:hypothetical protein
MHLVHAAPGHIRLRVTDTNIKPILKTFLKQLWQQDGVGEVDLNQQTGTISIAFDENKLPLPQMLSLLQELGVSQQPVSSEDKIEEKIDFFAAWKSAEFWKEQGLDFIPLMAGLAVTGGLGLSGWAALPVYFIASSATRQVIDLTRSGKEDKETRGQEDIKTIENSEFRIQNFKVVHEIPGRVRFHVPQLAQDRAYALRLQRLLTADAQVKNFRINSDAASVAIAYEPKEIALSYWLELLQAVQEEARANNNNAQTPIPAIATERELQQQDESDAIAFTLLPENSFGLPLVTDLESSFWAELKPPALSLSLSFMANFPLQTAPD